MSRSFVTFFDNNYYICVDVINESMNVCYVNDNGQTLIEFTCDNIGDVDIKKSEDFVHITDVVKINKHTLYIHVS